MCPPAVAGIGSVTSNGNGGFASINLRNLGPQHDLVLLDGDHLVPAAASGTVDLNSIAVALLQRVDILTGGASTTYNADAVSGIANFTARKNFVGMEASACK